jgi:hypothetical protein
MSFAAVVVTPVIVGVDVSVAVEALLLTTPMGDPLVAQPRHAVIAEMDP